MLKNIIVITFFLLVAYLFVHEPGIKDIASHPSPAKNYAEAIEKFKQVQKEEETGINPLCHSLLMTHGKKVAKTIAFVHGYTNCPKQFEKLGQQFFDLGYNVLVLRMPHHGLADRMTHDLTNFSAEEMIGYSDRVVDISQGLGEHVSFVGLSGGGIAAAWVAENRADVDQAVLIAPGLGLKLIPETLTTLVTNINLILPDRFPWWDPINLDTKSLPNGYPKFSWHGLAQQLRLALSIKKSARINPPAAKSIMVIINANDEAVNNSTIKEIADSWRIHGGAVTTYEFPAKYGYRHDLIDPSQSFQKTDQIYPELIRLISN